MTSKYSCTRDIGWAGYTPAGCVVACGARKWFHAVIWPWPCGHGNAAAAGAIPRSYTQDTGCRHTATHC
jgi:hypothetical protein